MLFAQESFATHIVGGELYYELKDSAKGEYKITLKVFMDCFNGNPDAIAQDLSAIIGVYDANTRGFIQKFTVSRSRKTRVQNGYYKCVIPPQRVCVDEFVYETTRILPKRAGGIILAFQRCCRNGTISNLVDPESTGATFWVQIPPSTKRNSSAVFDALPPNYVCINAPLQFYHTATDKDGDSLVYRLSQPFQGGSPGDPRPDPPGNPGYVEVIWGSGYSTNNQVDGIPKFSINSKTGEINLTPNKLGQYVIGIAVEEYRNGTLIGVTFRDFQINVIKCEFDILADFTTQGSQNDDDPFVFECQDTVFFKDRSLKADTYLWDFGDPTTDKDTSSAKNPWWVYPGNGNYRVTLTVKNDKCEDDYSFDVRIRSVRPFDLPEDPIFCKPFATLINTKAGDATEVKWSNGMFGQRIIVNEPGRLVVTVSYGQCVYKDTMEVFYYPVGLDLPDDTLICDEVDLELDAVVPDLSYVWSTSPQDTLRTLHVTDTGTYFVSASNGFCTETDGIRVWKATKPDVPDAFYCNSFVHQAVIDSVEEGSYLWSNGSRDTSAVYIIGGYQWVDVIQRHCVSRDSFEIFNPIVFVDLGPDQHFCDQVEAVLDAGPDKGIYTWSTDQSGPSIAVDEPGEYWVKVTDPFGCVAADTMDILLTYSPVLDAGVDTSICIRSVIEIGPEANDTIVGYLWDDGQTSRTIYTESEGMYKVRITDVHGCTSEDSIFVSIDPQALPNELFIPNAFTPNNDGRNDKFPFSEVVQQTGYYVIIYNRWGEKVFDSRTSEKKNWDGYYLGKKAPQETYLFYVEYLGCDGLKHAVKGTVNPLY